MLFMENENLVEKIQNLISYEKEITNLKNRIRAGFDHGKYVWPNHGRYYD